MTEPRTKSDQAAAPERELRVVGTPFRRVDGRAKVTGQTRFTDDLAFPRQAFVKLVRSTIPHGRIRSIDLSRAAALPGVLGFLTGKDLPTTFGILPVSQDEHPLALEIVRHVGDPVVAVAATSEDAAQAAALRVEVDYEPLPTIASVEEAAATDEPQLHGYADRGNLHKVVSMEFGDVEAGFAEAAHRDYALREIRAEALTSRFGIEAAHQIRAAGDAQIQSALALFPRASELLAERMRLGHPPDVRAEATGRD